MPQTWKVGELAKQTGLSVRTLHFYEKIGLLRPLQRTPAGHRLYVDSDIARLQRILSLRQLGFSLDEVHACLEKPEFALGPLIKLHRARLGEQIALQQQLYQRLASLEALVEAKAPIPVTQILRTMEKMTMIDQYLSPQQLADVEERRASYAKEHGIDLDGKQSELFTAFRKHMEAGDDPRSPAVQALAKQHQAYGAVASGGDPAVAEALGKLIGENADMQALLGLDDALIAYLARANAP